MKKILSLLLALSMLLGTSLLFTACSEKDGNVTLSKKKVEVDVTDYGIVYGDSMNGNAYTVTFTQAMADFATALSSKTGENYWAYTQERAKTNKADNEILIGLTDREESQKAYQSIKGDGFAIQVTEKKIVIVGSSNLMTLLAVQYFSDRFLTAGGEESPILSINKKITSNNAEMAVLADSENGYYSFVHQAHLGQLTGAYMGTSASSHKGPYQDHPQIVIDSMVQKMVELTKLREKFFPIIKDSESAEKEILVGYPDREENRAVLATLAENEYGVVVEGSKIHVTAWNDTLLINAAGVYLDILTEATLVNEDGTLTVALPQGLRLVRVGNAEWVTDFPRPEGEGIELYNTMEDGENSLQFLYTGSGINKENYDAYCQKLKDEGYSVLTQSTAEDSIFTTLVNNKEGISLYVAYNAYKHKDEFSAYDNVYSKVNTKDTGCYDFEKCFRIAATPLEYAHLPDSNLLTSDPVYEKKTDSMISTIPLYEGAVGLAYVIVLEDGRFIVFDGGAMGDNGDTDVRLWEWMSKLQVKITGKPVSSSNPIHIAAWILTHAHGDHYNAFIRLAGNKGKNGLLKIDYMMGNFPQQYSCTTDVGLAITPAKIKTMQSSVKGGFQFVRVRTGQKYYMANLEIEVITTWSDMNPIRICDGNDTNTVLRFTMTNKDNPSEVVTQMWTGDANRRQSRFMCATYGSYLKSDMVSIAHHGNVGLEIDFYDMVQAETVWWPHSAKAAHNYMNPQKLSNGWQYQVDQHIASMPCLKYMFISGDKASTDAYYITLVLTPNGPDYDNVFDASNGEKLEYNGVFMIKK